MEESGTKGLAALAIPIGNTLFLLSYVPLMLKLRWRTIVQATDVSGAKECRLQFDPCHDVALSSQIYMTAAMAIKYYAGPISSPKSVIKIMQQILKRVAKGVSSRSVPSKAKVYDLFMRVLSVSRLQNAISQGLALAAGITCLSFFIFGAAYEVRGGSHGRCGFVFKLLPLVALAVYILAMLYIEKKEGDLLLNMLAPSNLLVMAPTCAVILESVAIIPQAFLSFSPSEGTKQISMTTIVHYSTRACAVLIPTLMWWMENGAGLAEKFYAQQLSSLPGIMLREVGCHMLVTFGIVFYCISLWRLSSGRKWFLAVTVAVISAGIQLTLNTQSVTIFETLDAAQLRSGVLMTQLLTILILFIVGGTYFMQSLCIVLFSFFYSAGLLPTNFAEAKRRIQIRYAQLKAAWGNFSSRK